MISLICSNTVLFLVIIFLLFREEISARIFKKPTPTPPAVNATTDSVKRYEQSNPNVPPYLLHFMTGQRNALGLARLAIFEMYRDNELLDYDAMVNGIMERIQKYDNQNTVDSVMSELALYMKNKEPHTGLPNGPSLPGGNDFDSGPSNIERA